MTIHDYATAHGLSLREARRQLIQLALAQLDARARGGHQTSAHLSPAQRQDRARAAARARWAKAKGAGPKGVPADPHDKGATAGPKGG